MFEHKQGLNPSRITMPKNVRRIMTRQIIGYITPKRGKPIPVYGTEAFDFSRYPKPPAR